MWVGEFLFFVGACVGSFLNVVVLRLHRGESLMGRSHCSDCGAQLAWYHNVPILSFVWLRGRCAFCGVHIAWQYPLVEVATAILFALGGWLLLGDLFRLIVYLITVSFAVALFTFDFLYSELPDELTLSGASVMVLLQVGLGMNLLHLLIAALVPAGFFALQYVLSRGRWIGGGDIRLGLFMGVALGWPMVLVALVLAYVVGAACALLLVGFKQRRWGSQIPFGTFLTAATVVVFLWGEPLTDWYVRLFVW